MEHPDAPMSRLEEIGVMGARSHRLLHISQFRASHQMEQLHELPAGLAVRAKNSGTFRFATGLGSRL